MQIYPEIKRFVQEALGCSCPEDVFNEIEYQENCDGVPGRKVKVADRLLIYIITTDGKSDIQKVVDSALARGIKERDNNGLNRFRLVLVASRPDELRTRAVPAFNSSGYTDEKTHLHVVSEAEIEGF
jgi:hypothetical protein